MSTGLEKESRKLRLAMETELTENILPFWLKHLPDRSGEKQGQENGFHGAVSRDGRVISEAPKGLVMISRICWTFAAAYRYSPRPDYMEMASRAHAYLREFYDEVHGGYFWMLNGSGQPLDRTKELYGQSFALYALAEYYKITRDSCVIEQAVALFKMIENHCFDIANKGYFESFTDNWRRTPDSRIGGKNDQKSMNTHLHMLESYTNLYKVWPVSEVKVRLEGLLEVYFDHILDLQKHRQILFFNDRWEAASETVSYGHDIEASWLLVEAAEALGDEKWIRKCKNEGVQMAEQVLRFGTDQDGGVWNELEPDGTLHKDKDWWPQAEAVVGFINAYQCSGEVKYMEAAFRCWSFIDANLIDKIYGEWFGRVDQSGYPATAGVKADAWKCPYHNGRACLEASERLVHIAAQ